MTPVLTLGIVVAVSLAGVLLGLLLRGLLLTREDRRRLDLLASRLVAEQRVDQLTRSTLAAMRDTARQAGPGRSA